MEEKKITDVCKQLEPILDIIYKNEDSFLDTFAPNANDLVEVYFSTTRFKFVFILLSGQHIVDDKPLEELEKWIEKIKK